MSAEDLFRASSANNLTQVQDLLQRGVDPNGYKDRDGWTPLWSSSLLGHAQIVRELLAAGAHVDAAAYTGRTPLFSAATYGHLDAVKVLVDAWANLQHMDKAGITALDLAKACDHQEVVAYLSHARQVSRPTSKTSACPDALRKSTTSSTRQVATPTKDTPIEPASALSQLWSSAISGSLTEQSITSFLIAPNVNSIQMLIIAHNIMLLAVHQKVVTIDKLKSFRDDPDYVATNLYLPLRGFMNDLDDYEKVMCKHVLRQAQRISIIENHHVFSIKLNADAYGEIDHSRKEVSKVIEKVTRELQDLDNRVTVSRNGR